MLQVGNWSGAAARGMSRSVPLAAVRSRAVTHDESGTRSHPLDQCVASALCFPNLRQTRKSVRHGPCLTRLHAKHYNCSLYISGSSFGPGLDLCTMAISF